jgi:hypothetical protein
MHLITGSADTSIGKSQSSSNCTGDKIREETGFVFKRKRSVRKPYWQTLG